MQLAAAPLTAATPVVAPSSQQEYWARFDNKDWDAAIAAAEQLVAAARPATEESAIRLGEALALLGNAQLGKGNLVAAEAAFNESLQLTERYAGASSAKMVDPLRGLGYTLAAEGKHPQAIPYMDRALLISRRNAGLFDVSQQGLLRQLATSLTTLGQATDAERHMQYLLRLGEHVYGVDDPRMIALHCTVGEWYAEIGQMEPARLNYRTALGIAERKLGRNSLATIEPLRSLADSYTREVLLSHFEILTRTKQPPSNVDGTGGAGEPLNPRYLSGDGERALARALKVLDSNTERPDQLLIETLLQTGDWYLTKQQTEKALPYYRRAASLISSSAGQPAKDTSGIESALSFPVQVYYPTPSLATRNLTRPPNEVNERFVQVEFTVTRDGSVKNERIADKDATERQISQTLDAIRAARYRPKFVDGNPVETTALSYRQVFRQRKETTE